MCLIPLPVSSLDGVQSISSPTMTLVIHTRQHLKEGFYPQQVMSKLQPFYTETVRIRKSGSSMETQVLM